jgi:UDP-N-acetylmuramate dehydrogenase
MTFDKDSIIVDAGVWWDNVVKASVDKGLWGIEMLSEIPGSVGAALVINIAAYGQTIGQTVKWVELWHPKKQAIVRFERNELFWSYKQSVFQSEEFKGVIILRACFVLSPVKTVELGYQKAIDIGDELQLDSDKLPDRRSIIIEARRRAGSLWHHSNHSDSQPRTAGSFFRNPLINSDQVEAIIKHDESSITATQIKKMNLLHGGNKSRVSAAHVMLAAGFSRGQVFENVKLNDNNLLKIEALDGATAKTIYSVMRHIQQVCQEKLNITLEPEVQLLGDFDD